MLDIKFIRENPELVKEAALKKRSTVDIDLLLKKDDERRDLMQKADELRAEQNKMSGSIAREQDKNVRDQMIMEMTTVKNDLGKIEEDLKAVMSEWQGIMLKIPNIPSADTPSGEDETSNVVLRQWGEKPAFSFQPKEHFEIAEKLGLIDIETAGKVAGARFSYIKGNLARLQFALVQMAFDLLTDTEKLEEIKKAANLSIDVRAFIPVVPPVFVRPIVQVKMARYLTPDEHYLFPNDDLMLVGSAEHTLGSMHMDQIFTEADLPIRYVGYSTAFRREAGSHGKDMKGILRQHQFDKLEMEVFSLPENSVEEQNFLVAIQEHAMQLLKLPYQVVSVCTGDMGFPNNRQLDIETWMPGQDKYRETQSADLTGGFQARRLNTRVRRDDGRIEPVHMNDATMFAIGRTLIAIIENYQTEDGKIRVPEVLKKYINTEFL